MVPVPDFSPDRSQMLINGQENSRERSRVHDAPDTMDTSFCLNETVQCDEHLPAESSLNSADVSALEENSQDTALDYQSAPEAEDCIDKSLLD